MSSIRDVLRLDPRLDTLVDTDAQVEKILKDQAAFFEGPVWVQTPSGGHLIFTDIASDAILALDGRTGLRIIADSFFDSSPASCVREIDLGSRRVQLKGPDGLALDRHGRILYCGYGARHVGRLEPDGRRTVLAESFEGRRLNTPNDLVVRSDGTVYFTDSSAESREPKDGRYPGVATSAVYRIAQGGLQMLNRDFDAANGLVFSPDEQYLYVNDTRRKLIWRFEAGRDGPLGHRDLFADMNSDASAGVPDGMKVDMYGNVYCTGPRGLWVIAPDGTPLGIIQTRERLTNLAFGGAEGDILYMTGPSYVWRMQLKVRGASLPSQ